MNKSHPRRRGLLQMSWKRKVFELAFWCAGKVSTPAAMRADQPRSIFIIQPSHIGDLLIVTPLFEAIRKLFPTARIVVGVGSWNEEVLKNNPHVSEVVPIDVPWNNRFVPRRPWSPISYMLFGNEVQRLRASKFDMG